MAGETQTSINIPQLIAVAVVGFLAIRWWMSKPSTTASGNSSSSRRGQVDPARVDQVSNVFPQLDRRSIAWDLQRNGGNVEATTERVLSGRGLESPPPSFQPALPTPAASAGSGARTAGAAKNDKSRPDLITRYGLQSKVSSKGKEPVPSEEQQRQEKQSSWSSDKAARADNLKRRREQMILEARRKMAEKDTTVS